MFILTTIADTVQIEPADFKKPSAQAIEDNINQKYANKVIQQVGLCICFYDLLSSSDGMIGHGDGIVNVNAKFRLIVFRPFKGEVLEGKVGDSTPNGIRIHLDFFTDISVPGPNLFEDSKYDLPESVWIWTNDGQPFYFDRGERVRFRVEEEFWHDQAPGEEPPTSAKAPGQGDDAAAERSHEQKMPTKAPWRLVASMQQGGLGLISWWED